MQHGSGREVGRAGKNYITVVDDLDRGTVEHIADERRQASLYSFFDRFSPNALWDRGGGHGMLEPFANSACAHLVDADDTIVFDRLHVHGLPGQAVDTVAGRRTGSLKAEGDKRLAGTKHLWPTPQRTSPSNSVGRFASLSGTDLKTPRAGDQRSLPSPLGGVQRQRMGIAPPEDLVLRGNYARLGPVVETATHAEESSPQARFPTSPIRSQTLVQKASAHTQTIRVSAGGYRNRENSKIAIYFHVGGLNLCPQTHWITGRARIYRRIVSGGGNHRTVRPESRLVWSSST